MIKKMFVFLFIFFLFTNITSSPSHTQGEISYINDQQNSIFFPEAMIELNNGDILYVDSYNHKVKKITDGKIQEFAGVTFEKDAYGYPIGGYTDGSLSEAMFNKPRGIVEDSKGNIYIADSLNHIIRKISDNEVSTFAGTGEVGYIDGDSKLASFNNPLGLTVDDYDNIYVADSLNHVIRKITPDGTVSTFIGDEKMSSGYKDGLSDEALFNEPSDIKYINNVFYISDTGNHLIRKIEDSMVEIFAGQYNAANEESLYPNGGFKDGYRLQAEFNFPKTIVVNTAGFILVADSSNNVIRLIDREGNVSTPFAAHTLEFPLQTPRAIMFSDADIYLSDLENGIIEIPISIDELNSKILKVSLNGSTLTYTVADPFMNLDSFYIPVRETLTNLDYSVSWKSLEKSILTTNKDTEILLKRNDFIIIDSRAFVDSKTLEKEYGLEVDFDLLENQIVIKGGI